MNQISTIAAVLGLNKKLLSETDLVSVTREGVNPKSVIKLANRLRIKKNELSVYLHISLKTLERYEEKNRKLPADLSDRLIQIIKVYAKANDVFEDEDNAIEWMKSKIQSLGNFAPMELMDTSTGIELVMNVLGRIEHGVYS